MCVGGGLRTCAGAGYARAAGDAPARAPDAAPADAASRAARPAHAVAADAEPGPAAAAVPDRGRRRRLTNGGRRRCFTHGGWRWRTLFWRVLRFRPRHRRRRLRARRRRGGEPLRLRLDLRCRRRRLALGLHLPRCDDVRRRSGRGAGESVPFACWGWRRVPLWRRNDGALRRARRMRAKPAALVLAERPRLGEVVAGCTVAFVRAMRGAS